MAMRAMKRSSNNNKLKDTLAVIGVAALVIFVLGAAVWYQSALWSECRQTNSFMYCMRVLSK